MIDRQAIRDMSRDAIILHAKNVLYDTSPEALYGFMKAVLDLGHHFSKKELEEICEEINEWYVDRVLNK